jgi:hypothetical protein
MIVIVVDHIAKTVHETEMTLCDAVHKAYYDVSTDYLWSITDPNYVALKFGYVYTPASPC